MSLKEPCPSRGELEEVLRGKVVSPQLEMLVQHLESCPACEETLPTIRAEDTFTDLFRNEASSPVQPMDPAVKKLIERIQAKDRARGHATLDSQELVAKSADSGTQAFADAKEPVADSLDFLAPPQTPEEMGRLGQYRILKVLGKGGMGMVLMGHDPHLDRMVAIKVMLPSIAANETAKQRFLREARTAAKLRSDHIVTIYQVSEDRGIPYLAMEYLEGAPLDRYMAGNRKLTVSQILRIAREITKGLADAHERGLIHRDIKPGNIWLDQGHGGRATILDFGLARFDSDAHITQSGAIIGTPAFMAPEQARGEKVDARADLFSLGCVLYRLCAGDIPFKAETTMGVLMALAMNDPTPPAKINSQIPEALSELIMKLLEKDAAKRPATAREVMARLQQIEKTVASKRGDPQKIDAGDMPTEVTNVELSLAPPMAEMASSPGLMTAMEQAKAEPKLSAPPRQRRPIGFGALVLLGLLFLGGGIFALLQMGVIRFSNEQGDYVIATDDPDFAFSVKKGSVILEDRKTKRKYDLKVVGGNKAAGELELEVTDLDADLAFKTKNFTIKRGQEVALKAWFERKQAAIAVPFADDDRKAAEYAISLGGIIRVKGDFRDIRTTRELPPGKLVLTDLSLGGTTVTDAELVNFKGCTSLTVLGLNNTKVTDVGIANFKDLKGLKHLVLSQSQVTDAGLANFKNCSNLTSLALNQTKVTDEGLRHFENCNALEGLLLLDTKVTDAGLAHFQGRKHIRHLDLRNTAVTDVGLSNFKDCKELLLLALSGTAATDAGLAHFAGCTKILELNLIGAQISGVGLAHFKDSKNLKVLDLGYTPITDTGLAHFKDCSDLRVLSLVNTQVSDEGMSHFNGCKMLTGLNVAMTQVTDAGLALFKDRNELIDLNVSETKVSNAGLASFKECKELVRLWLHKTQLSDACLEHFKSCKKLEAVHLLETQMTDAALTLLKEHKNLKYVNLTKTKVTTKGIADFHTAVPGCKIDHDGGVIESTPILADADRKAAEFILANGGGIWIDGEHNYNLQFRKAVPDGEFRLTGFTLADNFASPKLKAEDFRVFAGCKHLRDIALVTTLIGDEGIAHFQNSPGIRRLGLNGTGITDKGLAQFQKRNDLIQLTLYEPKLTDDGILGFAGQTELEYLDLWGKFVTDRSCAAFAGCTKLKGLHLKGDGSTDAGLLNFKNALEIEDLTLVLKSSEKAIGHFLGLKSLKKLLLYGGSILEPKAFDGVEAGPLLMRLDMSGSPNMSIEAIDALLAACRKCRLLGLDIRGKGVTSAGLAQLRPNLGRLGSLYLAETTLGAESVGLLKECVSLHTLNITKTKFTEADVKELAKALPQCKIIHDGGTSEPYYIPEDLKAVESALKLGGKVGVEAFGPGVADMAALLKPARSLRVAFAGVKGIVDADLALLSKTRNVRIVHLGNPGVTDAGLLHLKGLPLHQFAAVDMPQLTDAGLAHLTDCRWLTHLALTKAGITDDTLAKTTNWPDLEVLFLNGTAVTDKGMTALKNCPRLSILGLSETKVTDAGLEVLQGRKTILQLYLSHTAITDVGLAKLASCANLLQLEVRKTKVTEKGVKELAAALPNCRIEWDGGMIEPRSALKSADRPQK